MLERPMMDYGMSLMDYLPDWSGDSCGYLAAALVLATFSMKSMRMLRMTAIASNITFLLYAVSAHLVPVVILHGLLLPLNIFRLAQIELTRSAARVANATCSIQASAGVRVIGREQPTMRTLRRIFC
jgi:hypothetical protein